MKFYQPLNRAAGIFRTNAKMTGNVKLVIDGSKTYITNLLNTQEITTQVKFSKHDSYAGNIKRYYDKVNNGNFFYLQHENHNIASVTDDYRQQYITTYQWGARPHVDNKTMRFFAPLWLQQNKVPTHFLVYALPLKYNSTKNAYDEIDLPEIVKTGTLVHAIDLSSHDVGKCLQRHTVDPEFKDEPLIINHNLLQWSGIDLQSGTITTKSESTLGNFQIEQSILEANEVLSTGWSRHDLVCNNLINLEYVFDISELDAGAYQYVGVYTTAEDRVLVDESTLETIAIQKGYDKLANVIVSNKYKSYRYSDALMASTLSSKRKLATINRAALNRPLARGYRILSMRVNSNMLRGYSLAFYEKDVELLRIFCSDVDALHQFLRSDDIDTTYSRLAQKINDEVKHISTIDIKAVYYTRSERTLEIVCNSSTELDLSVSIPRSLTSNTTYLTSLESVLDSFKNEIVKIPQSLEFKDTLLLPKLSVTAVLKRQVYESDSVDLEYVDGTLQQNRIIEITTGESSYFLKFEHNFITIPAYAANEQKPSLTLTDVDNSELIRLRYHPISIFDTSMSVKELFDLSEFDLVKLKVYLNFQLNTLKQTLTESDAIAYQELLNDYFDNVQVDKLQYIEKIDILNNEITYNDNPFERLNEYDLQEFAKRSVLNPYILTWVGAYGKNGIGKLDIANISVAFGVRNFQPDSLNNQDRLQFSYFLIETPPPAYINELPLHHRSGYLAKRIDTNELQFGSRSRIEESFVHRITDSVGRTLRYSNLEEIQSVAGSSTGIVTYRGVTYQLPVEYVGYDFAVLLLHDDKYNNKPDIDLVVNESAQFVCLLIKYLIVDTFISSLNKTERLNASGAFFDRHIFYYNAQESRVDAQTDIVVQQQINIRFGLNTQKRFKNNEIGAGSVYLDGNEYNFAINVYTHNNNPDFQLLNELRLGESYLIVTSIGNIVLDRITDIQYDYFWCRNVFIGSNGTDNFLQYYIDNGESFYDDVQLLISYRGVSGDSILQLIVDNRSNDSRYAPLQFFEIAQRIAGITNIDIVESDKLSIISDIDAVESDLSHTLATIRGYNIALERRAMRCQPLSYDLVGVRDSTVGVNDALIAENKISEYGIWKVGNESTLKYTAIDKQLVHTLAGEVATDKIEFNPHRYSLRNDFYKFYQYRNRSVLIDGKAHPINFPSTLSTAFSVAGLSFIVFQPVIRNQLYTINIENALLSKMSTIESFKGLTGDYLRTLAQYLLIRYKPVIRFVDDNQSDIPLLFNDNNSYTQGAIKQSFDYTGVVEIIVSF